ncbi:hypothetical protein SLEP1_g32906 [Rubroshorea leprosula]|uniref:Uncharacterized protein n=1 Tax=Rubroshorea leprosula TaxID=152421 RepID=A0AAV5KEW6_9ROSI|nr:hypothetical protein SLEP1_g32906 [Rubroshorea leprosula]
MRGMNGDGRDTTTNNPLETINAAANAIASTENRVPRATIQKRRWGSCWSLYWCFGAYKQRKRIGHAVLAPEMTAPATNGSTAEITTQTTTVVLPFVAPPSSPVSFLQSEPPSVTQSPAGILSLNSMSSSMYSPGGRPSIFAIGPYAHETQLVSPPVFSTFTTEPSTAPFTPPPESVHLTTPSSPEVPFAQLLDPHLRNGEAGQGFPLSPYEFHSYQFHPGSPVGQLISPSSGISGSGTSSPFPDGEFTAAGIHFPEFRICGPPKLLNLDKLSSHEWGSRQGSGTLTPDATRSTPCNGFLLDYQLPKVASHPQLDIGCQNDQVVVNHRVSFELTAEDVRFVEKKTATLSEAVSESLQNETTAERRENVGEVVENHEFRVGEVVENHEFRVGETSNETPEKAPADEGTRLWHQKHRSITLGSIKEFNFDNTDGVDSNKPTVSSDWWANEEVVGKDDGANATKNWSFPVMQTGIS